MFEFIKRLFKKGTDVEVEKETTELSDAPEEVAEDFDGAPKEGRIVFRVNHSGNKGKICINNGEVNRYIRKDEPIPEGWKLGGKKR